MRAEFKTPSAPSGPLLVAGDALLVFLNPGMGPDTLACLDLALREIRWSQKASSKWTSSRPYGWQGTALAGDEEGGVAAFHLADGAPAWSHTFPKGVIRGIGSDRERLYVGTLSGMVYAFRPGPQTKEGR